jgi:hypothetical protein
VGEAARRNAAAKRTQAEQAVLDREMAEDQMGPVLVRDVHKRGCPKCGEDKALKKRWCPGYDERHSGDQCQVVGHHLHGTCVLQEGGCGFYWREECRDVNTAANSAKALVED